MRLWPLLISLCMGCASGSDAGTPITTTTASTTTDTAIPVVLAACADGTDSLSFQLSELFYRTANPTQQVLTDDASWQTFLELPGGTTYSYGYTSGTWPTVDFTTHVVFVNFWADGGCEDKPTYAFCLSDDSVTGVYAPGKDDGCDAYFPQVDLLVVPRSEAQTFQWTVD